MQKSPCVYIVGAGPGDPGLITVRGLRQLEAADVVVYDHQVHARLLRAARPDAEKIDVGPAAPRALDQDAISLLLVEKAREGKTVVRLKWGDPFVFDSGGKEALFLHEQQIPFEVVPGIPATIARAGLRRHPDHVSWRRRHRHARPRQRGRDRRAAEGGLVQAGRARRHAGLPRGSATDRRDRQCAAHQRPLARGVGGADLQRHHQRAGDDRRHARDHRRQGAVAGAGDAGDRRGGRAARSPALVRRPAAVRPADRGHAIARAGGRAGGHARGARRRSDPGADDPDRPAGRSRPPSTGRAPTPAPTTGSCSRARTRSSTSCSACSPTATSAT